MDPSLMNEFNTYLNFSFVFLKSFVICETIQNVIWTLEWLFGVIPVFTKN